MGDWRRDSAFLNIVNTRAMLLPGSVRQALAGDAYSVHRMEQLHHLRVRAQAKRRAAVSKIQARCRERVKQARLRERDRLEEKHRAEVERLEAKYQAQIDALTTDASDAERSMGRLAERADVLALISGKPCPRELRQIFMEVIEAIEHGHHVGGAKEVDDPSRGD